MCVCVTDTSTDCGQHPLIDRTAIKESKAKKGVGGTCCDGGNRNEVGRQLGQITSSETGRKEVQRKRRAAKEKGYAIIEGETHQSNFISIKCQGTALNRLMDR